MILAGVLGFPVGHSRSPAMMEAAFRELGLDEWRYLRLPVPPDRFPETARALPVSGFAGANVTIPHKLDAYAVADVRSRAVEEIGAANTLTFTDDGQIEADNTDAGGFLDALGESPRGRTAVVLGSGGAGRAVAWALREEGAETLVWNRTPARARELASELALTAVDRPPAGADIVVNATAVGLDAGVGEELALQETGLAGSDPPPVFCDLVYGREPTALCRWAERGGSRLVDGLEVLVRQGARSLERWTARTAPVDVMRRAASR